MFFDPLHLHIRILVWLSQLTLWHENENNILIELFQKFIFVGLKSQIVIMRMSNSDLF